MRVILLSLLLACLSLGLRADVNGQEADTAQPAQRDLRPIDSARIVPLQVPGIENPRTDLAETRRRLNVAQALLAQRNYLAASSLLEMIVRERPDNEAALQLLLKCYSELKRYEQAEHMIRDLIEKRPDAVSYRISLAELLIQDEREEEARIVYDTAAARAFKMDRGLVESVLESALDFGMTEWVLARIDAIRDDTGDTALYALQRGNILRQEGRYGEAVGEYFPMLVQDTTRAAALAERELLSMLEYVESAEETRTALLGESEDRVSPRALRLMSTYHLLAGEYEEAFRLSLFQDSLEQGGGSALAFFMRQCFERQRFEQVLKMGEVVLDRYQDSPIVLDAHRYYADALAEMGFVDSAIWVYQRYIARGVNAVDRAFAAARIGHLYADKLNDCETALIYYDSAATVWGRGGGATDARLETPRCLLRLGRLDDVEAAWSNLLRGRTFPDWQEEAAYHRALIQFFRKDYDSAKTAFKKLTVDFPQGLYVNDVIGKLLAMTDAAGNIGKLDIYMEAEWYRTRHLSDSAYLHLSELASDDSAALAEVSHIELAEIELQRADTAGAVLWIEQLLEIYPESYWVPFALRMKADILATRIAGREEALSLYRGILEHYPNYPFMSEVRRKLKQLEETRIG